MKGGPNEMSDFFGCTLNRLDQFLKNEIRIGREEIGRRIRRSNRIRSNSLLRFNRFPVLLIRLNYNRKGLASRHDRRQFIYFSYCQKLWVRF